MSMKKKLAQYGLGLVVVAVAVRISRGVKHNAAEPAGRACSRDTKCRGDGIFTSGMCLESDGASYCTHECSASDDCTTGMKCEAVEGTWTTETSRGMHATQIRSGQGTKNVCLK